MLQKTFRPDDDLASMNNVPINIDKAIKLDSNAESRKGRGELIVLVTDQLIRTQIEFELGMSAMEQSALEPKKKSMIEDKSKGFRSIVTVRDRALVVNDLDNSMSVIAILELLSEWNMCGKHRKY